MSLDVGLVGVAKSDSSGTIAGTSLQGAPILPFSFVTGEGLPAVRAQIRTHLAAMSKAERKHFLSTTSDPLYFQAVLEAPSELSGIDNETRQAVYVRAVDAANPGKLAEIERQSQAAALLEASARALSDHVADLIELPPAAMDDFISGVIPDQRNIEADAARIASAIAA